MCKRNLFRALAAALLVVVAVATGTAAYRAAAGDAAATNHMQGWDGNGMGTAADKPNDAGWTCSDNSRTWLAVQTGADYHDYYRDNLTPQGVAQRVIIHGNTDAAYSFPVASLEAGKIYKFHCGFSNMNSDAVQTTFSIASQQFGAGTVCGSFTKKAPKWTNTTTADFLFEVPADGTYYLCWQTSGAHDRAMAWGFSVVEATGAHRVTFVTGDGATAVPDQLHEGTYTVQQPEAPTKAGFDFAGWYANAECTGESYNFATQQSGDLTLYAKFNAAAVNYMQGWDGNGRGTTTDIPTAFGWQCTDASLVWSDASSATGTYSNYYRDNLNVDGTPTRVLSHNKSNAVFSFPVKNLEGGKFYKFHACNTNMNANVPTTFAIGTQRDGAGTTYGAQTKTAPTWGSGKYVVNEFLFRTPASVPAEVYMTWQTTGANDRNIAWGFSVKEATGVHTVTFHTDGGTAIADQYYEGDTYTIAQPAEPTKDGFDFAGWYADAAFQTPFDFATPRTGDTDLYARFLDADYAGPLTTLNITTNTTLASVAATAIQVADGVELHLTDPRPLRCGSTITLGGEGATLYLDQTYGEDFATLIEPRLTVSGRAFDATKDRVAVYRNGCLVMPGDLTHTPVTAYTGENLSGTSLDCQQDVFYRLNDAQYAATYDNQIRSLHIRKGYMACLANNPDGTGFSKVFIANDGDLDVNTLPAALRFASFIRVARWDWPGKRGKANQPAGLTRSSWYYNWSAGKDNSYRVTEFVPIHQKLGWPGWGDFGNIKGISHVLGLNEPDHTDQANATVEQAIEQWYHMAESGLRIGSPACDCLKDNWLYKFIELADELNYRVDFTAAHMYWNGQSGSSIVNSINAQSNATGGRPVWITEWNNGANWTSESWPDASGEKRDADFNIIYDANGNATTVTRPHTAANSAKQVAWLKDVLPALDNCDKMERHAFYDWVQDARAIVINNKLTPAGEYFTAYDSKPAYRTATAYDHQWHIAPPYVVASTVAADNFKKAHLRFYDHNGETGANYIVERQTDGGDWEVIKTLVAGTDYQCGDKAVPVVDDLVCTSTQAYRIKATAIAALAGTVSAYSRTVTITRDAPDAVTPAVEAVCATKAHVSWTKPTGARAFKLERAVVENGVCGEYATLASDLTATEYNDEGLTPATTYRYRLTTLSSDATDPSATADVALPALTTPATPTGLRASNGDNCIALTWAFAHDAQYDIWRSTAANGTFTKIATDVDATRYADTQAQNGDTYYYKIEAKNAAGTSLATDVVAGTAVAGQRAHFKFDEGEGTEAFDEWGGYNATLHGATWESGRADGDHAVKCTKSAKTYVQVGDDITRGLNSFTVAAWVRCDGGYNRLFDFGTGTNNFMIVNLTANGIKYKLTNPTAGMFEHTFNHANPKGVWQHLVIMQDAQTLTCYANGQLVGSVDGITVCPDDLGPTNRNYLTRSQWPSDAYPDLTISDFRIYNRALTEAEVQSLYGAVPVEIAFSNRYATLYYGTKALTVPEGITAATYTVNGDALVESQTYEKDDVIAAGTAVVLHADEMKTYYFAESDIAGTGDTQNMLCGSDVAATTTAPATMSGDVYFYKLSTATDGGDESIGFYWDNSTGAAFTIPAHRAYLVVQQQHAHGLRAFVIGGGNGTTGLQGIGDGQAEAAPAYNVNGQRVSPSYKGLVITRGQKTLRK